MFFANNRYQLTKGALFLILMSTLFFQVRASEIDSLRKILPRTSGEERIRCLIGLSYRFLRTSADSSLIYASKALEYSRNTDNRRGIARALLMMGNGYNVLGNNYKALEHHQQALEIFQQLNDSNAVAITYSNLGIDYQDLGRYAEAIDQYRKAAGLSASLGNAEGVLLATNNIGSVYEDWGKYNPALESYHDALDQAQKLNDERSVGITLQNIAIVNYKTGKYEPALDYLEQSMAVSRKIRDDKGIYNTYLNKGMVFEAMGMPDSALINLEKALDVSILSGNEKNIAEASIRLGNLYTVKGDYVRAFTLVSNALNLAGKINDMALQREAHKSLSDYYQRRNDYKNALLNFQQYTAIKDSIFNEESRKELSELQTLYELDKMEKEIEINELRIQQQQARMYYILSAIAVLVLISLLLFNRYQLKQKNMRTELEKKNIDIEQRLLRTQMNPHFIFNSLNSINAFITLNNPGEAQRFLTKFSTLMRAILENSRKSTIPIEDEIETLRLNIELEQLRFNNRFDFRIELDDEIDKETTYIPPMLIQPFVENAILHGLSPRESGGLLVLGFRRQNGLLKCIVEDNGVGREVSSQNKKTGHRSLGMQVTRERLQILNERAGGGVGFEIHDLKDATGNPAGTRVEIYLPCETE
ncbi:MAG: hypothetical protein Kow00127_18910 [Bacteroidales bacterium]